jgi:hypothetical protein
LEELFYLELTKQIFAAPSFQEISSVVEGGLQRLFPHDYATVAVCDDTKAGDLRMRTLVPDPETKCFEDTTVPIASDPAAWVLTNQEPR